MGKTRHVAALTEPTDTIWLNVSDHVHAVDLAAYIARQFRARGIVSDEMGGTLGRFGGPTGTSESLTRAEELGAMIASDIERTLDRPFVIVIDELERLDGYHAPMRLIESLVRNAPPMLRIVLVTRTTLPFPIARLPSSREIHQVTARELALDHDELVGLIVDSGLGNATHPLVAEIADRCGSVAGTALVLAALGRRLVDADPTLVRLPAELQVDADLAAAATRWLLGGLDAAGGAIVDDLFLLREADVADLARLGHVDIAQELRTLRADRLVEEVPGHPGRFRCVRAVASAMAVSTARLAARASRAVDVAIERGDPRAALLCAMFADQDLIEHVVRTQSSAAIAVGSARVVIDAICALDDDRRRAVSGLAGQAHYALGEWRRAHEDFEVAATVQVTSADAWRHGLILYLQGETNAASDIYERALLAGEQVGERTDASPAERAEDAMLLGHASAAAWMNGRFDAARELAVRSLDLARGIQSDAALAVAHTAAALVAASDGDRGANERHYARALEHAELAGDTFHITRVRLNQGSRLLEEGEFTAAMAELDHAVRAARIGGYRVLLGLALSNRGEVHVKTGRLDEARADLIAAVELLKRQGSNLVTYPLSQLARVLVARGDTEQARAICEEAISRSEGESAHQVVVVARLQLARALAESDPVQAAKIAREAAELAPQALGVAELWATLGALHLRLGDRPAAHEAIATAMELARARRDRFALARAIEVSALIEQDAHVRQRLLAESNSLFTELGCALDVARLGLHLAVEEPGDDVDVRIAAIADIAMRAGARPLAAAAAQMLRERRREAPPRLAVAVLGTLHVDVHGAPLAASAWPSDTARTLFKMLVTARRSVTRDAAIEGLWPGANDRSVDNKLAVVLASIRGVLDPDHEFPDDHYIRADAESIGVVAESLTVDVDRFLSTARAALEEAHTQPGAIATAMLFAAEASYSGDVLEGDPSNTWYEPLREEARTVYLDVARELAASRSSEGDANDAIRLHLRILEREPFDEHAHVELIGELTRIGRHGDAHRHHQLYVQRMRELELEPRPFPPADRPDAGSGVARQAPVGSDTMRRPFETDPQ